MESVVKSLNASRLIADTKRDAQTELAAIEKREPQMLALHEQALAVWTVARDKLRTEFSTCRSKLGDQKEVRETEACISIGYGANISLADIGDGDQWLQL